ncbi:hypothetical protein ABZW18_01645 [Streptomyces sp. NPDC004647]|uniref:hypothetical protein n=1 Tax=Streptomyces sp. NPDC004647 TaxID=3154671 RepID=UPI0033A641B7
MTHPLTGGVAPSASARRTAWAEGFDQLRAGATTEPGRLRIIGAVLAALVIAFGGVTAWQVSDRAAAASDVVDRSQPLSADAASIYRSLADADTSAAAGFLAGGQWPRDVRERYERNINTASELLVRAAANSAGAESARRQIAKLNEELPVYTGLIEQARANNRQGLPLGGAYLRYANDRMRTELLPAARALYDAETARLGSDYDDAKAWPWAALGVGVATLAALIWAQRRNYHRTNRVFNRGLLAATATSAVVLLWLAGGHAVAVSGLNKSYDDGARSLRVLNEARIGSLQARGDESLTLVARGAVLTDDGKDFYEVGYGSAMGKLVGTKSTSGAAGTNEASGATSGDGKAGREGGAGQDGEPRGTADRGTLLARAEQLADDAEGREPVRKAMASVADWRQKHRAAREDDEGGNYEEALDTVIGNGTTTGTYFDQVDANLRTALAHEQREFTQAADSGRGAFTGLPAGAAVLALLGAVGAVLGMGRRLSEYR